MTQQDWDNHFGRAVMLFVNGEGIRERGQYGQRHVDDSFLLCFNAHDDGLRFTVPGHEYGQKWEAVISTAEYPGEAQQVMEAGASILVPDRSLVVLDRSV
jgi:glycogen operon protein